MRYPAAVETLDYAPRPAARPKRDRPVSAVAALVLFLPLAFVVLFQMPYVGWDPAWLLLGVPVAMAFVTVALSRSLQRRGWRGWRVLVGLPLLAAVPVLVGVIGTYHFVLPGRAFRSVFHESPPADARLTYAPVRVFSAGGHGFYFHADADTVARLVTAAGMTPDPDDAARATLVSQTPKNAATLFLLIGGFPLGSAPGRSDGPFEFYSRQTKTDDARLLYDPATGEVWTVKMGH